MFEFKAKDISVGDEFTVDNGQTWWRASRVESRPGGRVWIESQDRKGTISSTTYAASDMFIVR